MARPSRSLPRLAVVVLAAATVVGAAEVEARADDASQARALFEEAGKLLDEGKAAAACPKLEESLRLFNGLGTRGRLAECYERSARPVQAWNTYKDVALLAKKSADTTREQVALQRAKALEPKVGRIMLVLAPSRDVTGLVLRRNGVAVERDRLGSELAVDPGLTTFEVTAPGRKTGVGRVVVGAGQTMKFEVPELEREDAAPAPTPPAPAPETPPPSDEVAPPPARLDDGRAWQRPLGLGLAGAGVVSLGASVIFGLVAKSAYDGAFDDGLCQAGTNLCTPAGQAEVDSARGQASLGTVFFVAGLALAGGGAALFLSAPPPPRGATGPAPSRHATRGGGFLGLPVDLAPTLGRRDAGLVVGGRF